LAVNNIEDLTSQLSKAKADRFSFQEKKKDTAHQRFNDSNGCRTCGGRGWVVIWDTLDSMSGCYAEYGDCTNEECTSETRELSGMSPINSKYDRVRGTIWTPSFTEDEQKSLAEIDKRITSLEREIRHVEALWTPKKGVVARVVKAGAGPMSRRTPVGTEGLIVRLFQNDWGTWKIILLDSDGKKWWPTLKNIEVIDPEPDTSVWDEMDKRERQEKGYPVVVTLKKKTGKAALLRTTTGVELWVPFSQAAELKDAKERDTVSVMLPMWLAVKKGFVTPEKTA